jgi:tetratricopeptide (TPR) repeat protein
VEGTNTIRSKSGPALIALAAAAVALAIPAVLAADEFDDFTKARNAYEGGEYQAAVERFTALLAAEPRNPVIVNESLKLLGVSYLFVGDPAAAEAALLKLLTLSPDFELDPMLFPIEVIDFFTDVKARNDERLAALARARATEEEARRKAEEKHRLAEIEKLKRNVYLERSTEKRSWLVALLPLGAGQFQNGEPVKGALFLGGEVLLGAAAATTFGLHESLRDRAAEPFESAEDRESYERLEQGLRIANQVSLGALAAVAVAGIIDSAVRFERERVTWQPVEEREVPENLRPGGSARLRIAPLAGDSAVGLCAVETF